MVRCGTDGWAILEQGLFREWGWPRRGRRVRKVTGGRGLWTKGKVRQVFMGVQGCRNLVLGVECDDSTKMASVAS